MTGRPPFFAAVNSGCYFSEWRREAERGQERRLADCAVLDMYELADYDLAGHRCLLIDSMADQEYLTIHRGKIRHFLDCGNVLVFCGHLFRPWLPGGSLFVPKTIRHHRDYAIAIVQPPHPIFAGFSSDELTYQRGVAGFFARGSHTPPPDAEVLLKLPGGEPTTYIDRASTQGTLLVHAGGSLWSRSGPRGRLGEQLLAWVRDECRRLDERRKRSG